MEGSMTNREPNIVYSRHGCHFSQDGVNVEVVIIKLEDASGWTLEVVNSNGTSIVWDVVFSDDDEAFSEFKRAVSEEGMIAFLDEGNIIPFPGAKRID